MLKFLIGTAAAFALFTATPASACGDCKDCAHHKEASATKSQAAGAVAEADKKDEKGCKCGAKTAKDCKCGDKCHCTEAAKDAKKGDKKS